MKPTTTDLKVFILMRNVTNLILNPSRAKARFFYAKKIKINRLYFFLKKNKEIKTLIASNKHCIFVYLIFLFFTYYFLPFYAIICLPFNQKEIVMTVHRTTQSTFAKRLLLARKKAQLSQYDVAQKADIALPIYYNLECESKVLRIRKETTQKIANVLNVSHDWLITGNGEMQTLEMKRQAEQIYCLSFVQGIMADKDQLENEQIYLLKKAIKHQRKYYTDFIDNFTNM